MLSLKRIKVLSQYKAYAKLDIEKYDEIYRMIEMGKRLKMTSNEYELVLETIQEGIIVYDRDSNVLFANNKALKIFEISEDQLLGYNLIESFQNFVNPDSSEMKAEESPVNIVISSREKLQNYMVGIKRPFKKSICWCRVNATPVFSHDSDLDKVVVSITEIDGNSQVEEKFKQLIKNSFDTLVLLDSDGIQHFVSESCIKCHGYSPEELTGISVIDEMIHPEDQAIVRAEFRNIVNNTGFGGVQYRHRHKNGGWVYLEAFGSNQIYNPFVNSVVLNVRDITDRKNAEQKLKENEARLLELNATKDKFFSIISHDLKGSFHNVIGFSELLVDQIQRKDYQGIDRYSKIIQNSSQLAMDLLMNLLEWSLSQTGKMEFKPEYFEFVSFIDELTSLFLNTAEQKSITIYCELPHNLPVYADKAMLSTVLRNLILNGLKFTNPGGEMVISAEQNNDTLVVSVADNGVGIKKEIIEKLFRIEESYSTMGTHKEKGTGLGLLLCKEFVEKHDGKLWAESEETKGSTFRFTIPHQKNVYKQS